MGSDSQNTTAINTKGSYTSGVRSSGGSGPVKRFDNPKDAYNDSYEDIYAKLNGKSSWVKPDTTISQYINKYAPKEDNNDPNSYMNHAVKYFNKLLGDVVSISTTLGEVKNLLLQKGLNPEHEFTKMHLLIEDPKVIKNLNLN